MVSSLNNATVERTKNQDEEEGRLRWGWRKYKPNCLQWFNNDKWFMVFLLIFNMFQAMNGAFTNSSIPSLEKQFKFSSKMSGFIVAANDITGLMLLPFISHFGETRHKPKWLGIGALVSVLGGLVFTLPQTVMERQTEMSYFTADNTTSTRLCLAEDIFSGREESTCEKKFLANNLAFCVFIMARIFMGAGSVPILSLGVSFVDDNANPKYTAIYLGMIFASIFLSMAIGFLFQGIMLESVYVDVFLPEHLKGINSRDQRWIGNWWIMFFVSSFMLLVSGVMLFGFPRELPGTSERKKRMLSSGELRPSVSHNEQGLKGLFSALFKLLGNGTYLTQTVSKLFITVFWAGIIPFVFKIIRQRFGSSPRETGLGIALLTGPGLSVGLMTGSFISKKLHLKESLQKAAKWCFILQTVALLTGIPWLFPGCEVVSLAGVTKPYFNRSLDVSVNIQSSCNSACACESDVYDPVCGSDGVTYYSACHAGCTQEHNKQIFSNCTCISNYFPQTAQRGFCDKKCKNFILFIVVYTCLLILGQLNTLAGQVVLLRSVPENYRSLGMGLQPIFTKLFGNFPGPLIFGYFIDGTCLLWLTSCGEKGNCLEYDIDRLIKVIFIGNTAAQVLSWLFLFISWTLSKRIKDDVKKVDLNGNVWEYRKTCSNSLDISTNKISLQMITNV